MRVAFSDPQGRRVWRVVPYLPPLALFVLACALPLEGFTAAMGAALSVALFHFAGALPLRQGRARPADLECGAGYVDLTRAGTRSQRIHARSITGATTARTARGVLLTLEHAGRDQPISIEVESEADAEKIRHALGIGHGGFGTVGWRTTASGTLKAAFVGRILTGLMASLIVALGVFGGQDAAETGALLCAQFAIITGILGVIGWFAHPGPQSVVMTAAGLRVQTVQGWFTIPYDHVLGVEAAGSTLAFRVPPPYHVVHVPFEGIVRGPGLGPTDRDALLKQIMSASARARGLGPSKEDLTGRVDVLRRNGESPRDWLARLDMAGRMLESSSAGYRGHTLDAEDLWKILEDPEAEADLRAAAARVLRHLPRPDTRVRIDAAVAAVRDDATSKKLRIAINDDVDGASQELALLDAQEGTPPERLRQMYLR